MRFEEWKHKTIKSWSSDTHQRLGQWCFNQLADINPALAAKITGSQFSDPFYDDTNLRSFWFTVRVQGDWDDSDN